MSERTRIFRAGDVVRHGPSGEEWMLAYGDAEGGDGTVCACGWPNTISRATDCTMVEAATDDAHMARLRAWGVDGGGQRDWRHIVCKRELQRLRLLPPDPVTDFEIATAVRKAADWEAITHARERTGGAAAALTFMRALTPIVDRLIAESAATKDGAR
jgi:hypothetical protein